MVKHIYSVACESIIMDRDTNRASYINAVDGGTASTLPATLPPLFIGSLWSLEEGLKGFFVRVDRVSPSGSEIVLATLAVDVEAKFRRNHRTNIQINGLPVEEEGDNIIKVMFKESDEWQKAAELPIRIQKKQAPKKPPEK